jgi:hypothetical protein
MIASCFSCKERLRPAHGLEARCRGPVASSAGMGTHCSSARCLTQCGRTFVVAQDALCRARRARTFERSCAPVFNLAENSVRLGGDGLSFRRARIRRWRRDLVKEILSATHTDRCAIRHIRTCTSMAPLDGIDVRARKFHELPGKLLFSNASRILHRQVFALGLTQVPT